MDTVLLVVTEVYLDVQIVGGQDQLKQCSLVNLQEVSVPGTDVVSSLLLVLIVLWQGRVILVVGGPLDDFLEDGRIHIRQGDNLLILDDKKS